MKHDSMLYRSTRGQAPDVSFCDALLCGLAEDGGLYVPYRWPRLSAETIENFAGKPYADVAYHVIKPFIGDEIEDDALKSMIEEAYKTFRHEGVAPLVQLNEQHFILELFHGRTLAFKDVAMQLLGRLMDHVLEKRSQRATIVGATSGDTGGAAMDAFAGRERTDMFILFPQGRVSDVQRRQMTTLNNPNVHALAIDGTFDDCQNIVKQMFTHKNFRETVGLSGVNSINWARIVAQIVYYFTSAVALGAPHRPLSYCVPTGNFGDILAGFVAKKMGLPLHRLVIATNMNNILARTIDQGEYRVDDVHATVSPSMDIQISSNFERLLYEVQDHDAGLVRSQMENLKKSGHFSLNKKVLETIRFDFDAGFACEDKTLAMMKKCLDDYGYLLDPHTAVGLHVAMTKAIPEVPMVTLATAHPAKFPESVLKACSVKPELPSHLGNLMDRHEQSMNLPADQTVIEAYIQEKARATH